MLPSLIFQLTLSLLTMDTAFGLPCFSRGLVDQVRELKGLTSVTDFSDRPTKRGTEAEYVNSDGEKLKQLQEKVAATGILRCNGNRTSSANLVAKADVLVAAGHGLNGSKACIDDLSALRCTFQLDSRSQPTVAHVTNSGLKCPKKGEMGTDWVVFKLDQPIAGVNPYALPRTRNTIIPREGKITAVAALSADFTRLDPKTKKLTMPKMIQDCWSKAQRQDGDAIEFKSNCGASNGASGGAVLLGNLEAPTIIGVIINSAITTADQNKELRTGKPVIRKYNDSSFYTTNVAITGDLYDAIEAAAK